MDTKNAVPDQKLERFISQAAPLVKSAADNALALGKLVDELVAETGTEYGHRTIDTVAQDERLNCSAQWLRRCWALYRLNVKHGQELAAKYPKLSSSHIYQLARVLTAAFKPTADQTIDQQQAKWIHVFADEADKGGLSVDALRQLVSKELRRIGNHPTTRQKSDDKHRSKELAADGSAQEAFDVAVEAISRVAEPEAITSGKVTLTVVRTGVVRVLDQVVTAAEQLVGHGPDVNMAEHLRTVADKLAAIAARLAEQRVTDVIDLQVKSELLHIPASDNSFKLALAKANVVTLQAAQQELPATASKSARQRIESRLRRLRSNPANIKQENQRAPHVEETCMVS